MKLGAQYQRGGSCTFVVWAPFLKKVELKTIASENPSRNLVEGAALAQQSSLVSMEKDRFGYWRTEIDLASPETSYLFRLNGERDRPDPASHFQPHGVHSPSQVVDHTSFDWEDGTWRGCALSELIIYELHIGVFTPEGTFNAVIPRLDELKDTGVNALEIMPVAQFPGERNWGYDGVYPFAVQNSYGGPAGLKALVNACHKREIAVLLDVVYNHLGPEGNYLWDYGPYFTEKYKTPWGGAVNFDDAHNDHVRNFFIESALHWFDHYHIDALRLDAVHAIFDMSAKPFLQKLADATREFSRKHRKKVYLIAESNLNDAKIIRPKSLGGFGIDAQWCDDFHHSLHTLLTAETLGYYVDFGKTEHFVRSLRNGFVYSGQYSQFRHRKHGNSSHDRPANQFIVSAQNHDQIGNRMLGERLSTIASFEALKVAAAAVIFSPYIPLLFMGEEYGERAPLLYFISHSDSALIEAVRRGRKDEFKAFKWREEPPDPQSLETFMKSKLSWEHRREGHHKVLLEFHKALIRLRAGLAALSHLDKESLEACGFESQKVVFVKRWHEENHIFYILNFNPEDVTLRGSPYDGTWRKRLDSSDEIWNGPGSLLPETLDSAVDLTIRGHSAALYTRV